MRLRWTGQFARDSMATARPDPFAQRPPHRRKSLLIVCLGMATAVHPQLNKEQITRLSHLDAELWEGWSVRDQSVTQFLIGGKNMKAYTVDLFTPLTAREDGDNEGVSLYFFQKAHADSVEAHFAPDHISTFEFIYTRSFVVVIAYFSSNGKLYDIHTRSMLKHLRNHFTTWHLQY